MKSLAVVSLTFMGIENFITDALYKPNDYIAYHVGRELAELHPGKGIIEGQTGYFDLEEFVRADQCVIVHESSVFNHIRTDWYGPAERLKETIKNSWLNVLWRGQLLDVVLLTFTQNCYPCRHHWIIADNQSLAESFFKEVCDWTSEVRGEVLVFQDGEWAKNKKLFDAIAVFKVNVELYPNSWNTYDSLGEAYMNNGDKELAIENYKKSLVLNPNNIGAAAALK